MAIRTLLFDLGNVLVYFSHERMCDQIAEACGLPRSRIREMLFDGGLLQRLETGLLSEREFHRIVEHAAGRSVDFESLRTAGSDIFELNSPVVPVLDGLKNAGHRLVLLSNICVSHYEWVGSRWDVLQRFDQHVLSFRVGAVKPQPAIFEAALGAIGCKPSECFYTDDIAAYVATGRNFGLEAEVFTDVSSLAAHLAQRGVAAA